MLAMEEDAKQFRVQLARLGRPALGTLAAAATRARAHGLRCSACACAQRPLKDTLYYAT